MWYNGEAPAWGQWNIFLMWHVWLVFISAAMTHTYYTDCRTVTKFSSRITRLILGLPYSKDLFVCIVVTRTVRLNFCPTLWTHPQTHSCLRNGYPRSWTIGHFPIWRSVEGPYSPPNKRQQLGTYCLQNEDTCRPPLISRTKIDILNTLTNRFTYEIRKISNWNKIIFSKHHSKMCPYKSNLIPYAFPDALATLFCHQL